MSLLPRALNDSLLLDHWLIIAFVKCIEWKVLNSDFGSREEGLPNEEVNFTYNIEIGIWSMIAFVKCMEWESTQYIKYLCY